jgi:hypothetical protein
MLAFASGGTTNVHCSGCKKSTRRTKKMRRTTGYKIYEFYGSVILPFGWADLDKKLFFLLHTVVCSVVVDVIQDPDS